MSKTGNEIEFKRTMEIYMKGAEAKPTIEEMRILIGNCADCSDPALGIICGRILAADVAANMDNAEFLSELFNSPEFTKFSEVYGSLIEEISPSDKSQCSLPKCSCHGKGLSDRCKNE